MGRRNRQTVATTLFRSVAQHLPLPQLALMTESPTRQVRESLTAGTLYPHSRNGATHLPEAHLVLPVLPLYPLVQIDRLRIRLSLWADLLTPYLSDQTYSLFDHAPTANLTMELLMVDTRGDHQTTMDDSIVLSIPAIERSLVVEPQREALALRIAVTMAEEIRGSTKTGLCVQPPETLEDPSNPLHGGSPRKAVTLEMQGTLGTTASGSITEDILCRQVPSLGEHLQARASHRSTMHTNATHRHLDIRRLKGKTLHRLGPLQICRHLRMVPPSIPLELP
jgi:hypothetical protein